MVIAYHLIWTGYGWWLPNDPRGSGSHTVRNDVLRDLGEVHLGRKRVQPPGREVRAFYEQAHPLLKYPPQRLAADQIAIVGEVLGDVVCRRAYTCYACAVMPDHVHILIRKHHDQSEMMLAALQDESRAVIAERLGLALDHPVGTRGGWKVFLDTPDDIERTIGYIECNPLEWRLPAQRWPFVIPYDGWPRYKRR